MATSTTAHDGTFSLPVAGGLHRLRVEGPGLLASELRLIELTSATDMRIVVTRSAAIAGRVHLGGTSIARATVLLADESGRSVARAITDIDGRFDFSAVLEGRFRVLAYRGDSASPILEVDRRGPGPFADLELELGAAATVYGRIVDAGTGAGIAAQVTLTAVDGSDISRTVESSRGGGFRIDGVALTKVTLRARAHGYPDGAAVTVAAGRNSSPTIPLRRGGVAAGVVVDRDGAAIASARVELLGAAVTDLVATAAGPDGGGADERLRPAGELGVLLGPIPFPSREPADAVRFATVVDDRAATAPVEPLFVVPELRAQPITDGEGRFRVTGLAPGGYRLVVSHPRYATATSEQRDTDYGRVDRSVRITLSEGVIIFGQVSEADGTPVAGAAVRAAVATGEGAATVTDKSGRYRLPPLMTDFVLEVSAPRHESLRKAVVIGSPESDRELRVDAVVALANAVLRGRVRDPSGFAVRQALVSTIDAGGLRHVTTTDEHGSFSLDDVAAGQHTLLIEQPHFPSIEVPASTGVATEVLLPYGGGIEVLVLDQHSQRGVDGAQVSARGAGRPVAQKARAGVATLSNLSPGSWTVTVSKPGYVARSLAVTVPAGLGVSQITVDEVRVELARGATIAGTVRDGSGARVAWAKVRAGDRRGQADEQGDFRLVDVAPGHVIVEARIGRLAGRVALTLLPGDEVVTLEITANP